jgi:serine/threonine protein kinase
MNASSRETPRVERNARKVRAQKTWVAKPRVGDKLGSFRLLELLGEGGAGAVYRAEHTFLKRPVAIKVLHPELYLDSGMVARFFQEALAVNRARHRNLIDITDVVAGEDFPPFIVMELLEGEDLGDYIDEHAPISVSWVHAILVQICDALSMVHGLGIVHRDLKPENIFLMDTGEDIPTVKLLDFGIAKFLDNEDNRRRTWSGIIMGTPAYMPLEQIHGLPVDHRADIYALGVVLYELLAGRLPFDMDSVEDLVDSLTALEPPPPSSRPVSKVPEEIPPAVDRVVLRCLAVDPSKRFDCVADLSAAFSEAMPATRSRRVTPVRRPQKRSASEELRTVERRGATTLDDVQEQSATLDAAVQAAALANFEGETEPASAVGSAHRLWIGSGVAVVAVLLILAAWTLFKGRGGASSAASPMASNSLATPRAPGPQRQYRLVSVPPSARILWGAGREDIGQTPRTVQVRSGSPQVFVLRLSGYQESRGVIQYGDPNPVRVQLQPVPSGSMSPQTPEMRTDAMAGVIGLGRFVAPPPVMTGGPAMRSVVRIVRVTPPMDAMRAAPLPMRRVTDQGIVDPFRK